MCTHLWKPEVKAGFHSSGTNHLGFLRQGFIGLGFDIVWAGWWVEPRGSACLGLLGTGIATVYHHTGIAMTVYHHNGTATTVYRHTRHCFVFR